MTENKIIGPVGLIESKYSPAKGSDRIALVLHPHPLYGGNMHNKVVYTIYKSLSDLNFSVLRINFRGVGLSEGSYDNGYGELQDALVSLDWLKKQVPSAGKIWVCGFSFGSWVASRLMEQVPEIERLIAISPPVVRFGFDHMLKLCSKGLIVQGDQDDIVPCERVEAFVDEMKLSCPASVDYHRVNGADHFYKGYLDILSKHIQDYGQKSLDNFHQY